MAMRLRLGLCVLGALGLALGAAAAHAADTEDLAPYKMVRTLQNIQDQVIQGEPGANDMQRFLLGEIDRRLRSADISAFEDPRNVDAAMIYAMSGGNPETLDILAERDIPGNFDNRVTSILRRYLAGKGATAAKQLKEVVPEYRNTRIGPYLELIGANAVMEKETDVALKYFDWARLGAPGTIVEEAALRRALIVTAKKGEVGRALPFARRYARRFMTSPYASQFADIFVALAVEQKDKLPQSEIASILSLIERTKQREIYLRLARRSAIEGDKTMADFAADQAKKLSRPGDTSQLALAQLYSGIVNIPGDSIESVLLGLSTIPDSDLSPKDRFLREAARVVGEEVLRPPGEDSLTQVKRHMIDKEYRDMMSQRVLDAGKTASIANKKPVPAPAANNAQPAAAEARKDALDTKLDTVEDFVSTGRSKLNDIDTLLSGESN
jgi:chemotaxis protein MotC